MKIVVAARCRNDEMHIERFLHGYDFADAIVISDGGSTDNSLKLLNQSNKVILHHFENVKTVNGVEFNLDAPHMNFVMNKAKELEPDWLIFDDIDDVPNYVLRGEARYLFEEVIAEPQVNAFRLYMWNEDKFFPKMNRNFDPAYTSLWAWQPDKVHIRADGDVEEGSKNHVSIVGLSDRITKLAPPFCLLHYSWDERTIERKLERYRAMGIPFQHPLESGAFGKPAELPEWAKL